MKTLQKCLLSLVLAIAFLDLYLQFTGLQTINSLYPQAILNHLLYALAFPLSFVIGCLFTTVFSRVKFYMVSIALFLIGLCYGGYTITEDFQGIIYLRLIHGVLLSFVLVSTTIYLFDLISTKNIRKSISYYGLFFTIPALAIITFSPNLSNLLGDYWSFYISMFLMIFIATLSILLIDYLVYPLRKTYKRIPSDIISTLKSPGVFYSYLAITISSFSLGILNHQLITINDFNNKPSTILLIAVFMLSVTLVLITKLATIADYIGIFKGILSSLLLLAFAFSSFPLVENTYFVFIPIILVGISYGSIVITTLGKLKEVAEGYIGLMFSLYYILIVSSSLTGYAMSSTSRGSYYNISPLLFACVLIISLCIPLIRLIHHYASDYYKAY
ncbi:MFS transporter [Alkaliphilus pronyensis]|uniref:MFS transporter n=1 Tax=Alkaliphilus pronyensis TaxID=1482732 RepID=A0A6I0EXB7_9FIRM|nr:MFS transporter [Alkaliphilus pronyensis]KAB3531625.1 MFS transporter [Alkaliphilus pronyensis]